jgi:hypothetical protein
MAAGLIVVAYIVSQIQILTSRPPYEQQVLDALSATKLRMHARRNAALIFWLRWRLLVLRRSKNGGAVKNRPGETISSVQRRLLDSVRELKRLQSVLRLLPDLSGSSSDDGSSLLTLSKQISTVASDTAQLNKELKSSTAAQSRMIADLASAVKRLEARLDDAGSQDGLVAQLREENERLRAKLRGE